MLLTFLGIPAGTAAAREDEPRRIDVVLEEFEIVMPETIPAGPALLDIRNRGQAEHNVRLQGSGVDAALRENIFPGESDTLRIDFHPGTYYVWCPVGRHETYGMHLELVVTGEGREPPPADSLAVEAAARRRATAAAHVPPRAPGVRDATGIMKLLYWLGNFHPPAVSFPIGLLVAAAVAEILFMATGRRELDFTSRFCVWFGGLAAIGAGGLGWLLAGFRLAGPFWLLTAHQWIGTGAMLLSGMLLVLNERARRAGDPRLRLWLRGTLFTTALLVLAAGFFGGAMIYGLEHYGWQ